MWGALIRFRLQIGTLQATGPSFRTPHEQSRSQAATSPENDGSGSPRRPEAQLALRLRQKRRPPTTPLTPATIAERRFLQPTRSPRARLRRLNIAPSNHNETDNDLRRDPTPTSVQAGDSVFPSVRAS